MSLSFLGSNWSNMMFSYNTNQTLALTYEDYMNGEWRTDNLSEYDLYETVSPQIFNLIKKVVIRNLTSPFREALRKAFDLPPPLCFEKRYQTFFYNF